jgi:ATP-dependent DNA ligase
MKALAEATGRTLQSVKAQYDETGDLGLVAKVTIITHNA